MSRISIASLVRLAGWLVLFAATGLFTITEVYNTGVVVGMGLLALFFAIQVVNGRLWPEHTALEIPAVLFIGSAAAAAFISYQQGDALLQFARILAALALFTMVAESSLAEQRWLVSGLVLAAAALAVYWPLQHDFSSLPGKFDAIYSLGLWIDQNLPEIKFASLTGPAIYPTIAGAVLALATPFAAALALDQVHQRRYFTAALAVLAGVLILFTLALTSVRGAWLGLAFACGLALLAAIQRRWFASLRQTRLFWGLLLLAGILGALLLFASGGLANLLGALPDPTGTLGSRLALSQQSWYLAQDYFFTGSGLATRWMPHATYSLLIHTPFIIHAHNTPLEIWLEQGIFGVIALAWASLVVAGWGWRALQRRAVQPLSIPAWGWAGLFALAGVMLHDQFDVGFYVVRTLPVIGIALGLAWQAARPVDQPQGDERPGAAGIGEAPTAGTTTVVSSPPQWNRLLKRLTTPAFMPALFAAAILLAAALIWHRPLLAAANANLGALSQTRLELSAYDPAKFDTFSLDQVRQSLDLSAAQVHFSQALKWQPDQRTALQRSSEIALSRGEYTAALAWMETAWQALYRDDVTRYLYGDALVANGQPEKAAQVVQGLYWAESRLMLQAFYRYYYAGDYPRAAAAWKAVTIINPYNGEAATWQAEAEKKLSQP